MSAAALEAFLQARLAEDEEAVAWKLVSRRWGRRRQALDLVHLSGKRKILALHSGGNDRCRSDGPCDTLRQLAREYAGHPDYREEWRP